MEQSDSQYRLSPNQQDLLAAAPSSNQPSGLKKAPAKPKTLMAPEKENGVSSMPNGYHSNSDDYLNPSAQPTPTFPQADDSPYLGFDLDVEGDDQFDFDSNENLMDDFPPDSSLVDSGDLHDKRKSVDGKDDDDEGRGKRRETEGGKAKKPGRKPLTAEPTSVRRQLQRLPCSLTIPRNAKHKTVLPNEPSATARRSI